MKIAIFHNYMDNIGGAEIVALSLARGLEADLYTTNISKEKIVKMGFADVLPRIYSIGKLPKKAPFRQQIAFWRFRYLKIKAYDFYIIAGDWAMSAAVNHQPNIWYAHSPLNELWEFREFIRNSLLKSWKISPYDAWVWFNRKLTLKYSRSVNIWLANSQNTKNRIKKYYHQEAQVVYPPVICADYKSEKESNKQGYWLSVNRLINHKRIELQYQAFSKLPQEKLLVVGSYEKGVEQFEEYKKYLDSIKPGNVEVLSWLDYEDLKNVYQKSKAFLTTAADEDFGLTAIEAFAAGKPVLAPNEGGYKESVVLGTGKLIDNINSDKIVQAINEINQDLQKNPDKYRDNCYKRAQDFDVSVFIKTIKELISSYLAHK